MRNTLLITGTESFARGELENVTLEGGNVVLDSVGGAYLLYGTYTSPETAMPAFCNLTVSWNAELPEKTVIELEVRVLVGSSWSQWMSFGKWSPQLRRSSLPSTAGPADAAFLIGDVLTVTAPGGAVGAQLRARLYSDKGRASPRLRLLAVSVRPLRWQREDGQTVNRSVYLAGYSAAGRDPRFTGSRSLPLVLTGMANRYGVDMLPEELAYAMSDYRTADCRNAAFAAAAVGCCGFPCWQEWADIKRLRREIYEGYAVAVEIERKNARTAKSSASWVGVSGFGFDEEVHADFVSLVDPSLPSDGETRRTMALEDFRRCHTGRAIFLRKKLTGLGQLPQRQRCGLRQTSTTGEYLFTIKGEDAPLSEDFAGWIACVAQDKAAHPTTAHKSFQRLEKTPEGGVRMPANLLTPGTRFTIYAVEQTGAMRVAELRL